MKNININGRIFTGVHNTENGEVSGQTRFHYFQDGRMIWADYGGGEVVSGHLIGTIDDEGGLEFSYHHLNKDLQIKSGYCRSTPEQLPDGRLRFHESWRWTSGDKSSGTSIIEEVLQ